MSLSCFFLGIFFQNLTDQYTFIHRIFLSFDLLIVFVTFSCKYNDVSRLSMMNGVSNSFFPIDDLNIFSFCLADTCFDIINNRLRLFISRVIGCDDRQICQLTTSPISNRRSRERLPPQPNRHTRRFGLYSLSVVRRDSRLIALCA